MRYTNITDLRSSLSLNADAIVFSLSKPKKHLTGPVLFTGNGE
jgi:hypothetical protein